MTILKRNLLYLTPTIKRPRFSRVTLLLRDNQLTLSLLHVEALTFIVTNKKKRYE